MQYPLLTPSRRATRLCLLSALAIGTACGDDVSSTETQSPSTGSTSSDSPTSTTAAATTEQPGTTTTTGDADSSTTASVDPDSSSTAMDPTEDTETRGDSSSSATEDTTSTGEAESSSTGPGKVAQDCPYGDLTAPDLVSDTTLGQDSEFATSCGGGGAPDYSYLLTAPADGFYVITASSPDGVVDPIIAAFDGDCGGPELACNNGAAGVDSEISIQLTEGQVVTVVADGFALAGGAVDVAVTFFSGTCPDDDIGNAVPAVFTGDTTMSDNTVVGSCGGETGLDDTLTYTAPQDGVYAINTAGSAFDTVMYIRDECDGSELACNDNVEGDVTSAANLALTAGQEIVVVVDGAGLESGAYTVNIDRDECPDEVLPSTVPQSVSGSTLGEIDASFGSCGGQGAPGYSYSFTAPEAGIYTIDTTGSDFDTVLYAIDACGGADTQCSNDAGVGTASRINVTLAQDEEVLFVVDGANGESGDFDVSIELDECPDFDLGDLAPPMGLTASGNTTAEIDSSQPSGCGFVNGAADAAYTFTAPETGLYEFDTSGSGFDTVLYIYDGATCGGTELACDDDGGDGDGDSVILYDLVADQQITLIVDGYGSASGDYVVNARLFDPCGDGILEAPEVCDGTEIGQNRCEDFGFAGGSVGCAPGCAELDTTQCSDNLVVMCSSPGTAINDGVPTTSDTINIGDMGTIADVDVFLDVSHTFSADLEIALSADDLALGNNLAFDQCGGSDDVWAFFNDEGIAPVGASCDVPIGIEGNVIPEMPMSVYDGGQASGSWTLSITDDAGGDTGTFNEWCLYITLED